MSDDDVRMHLTTCGIVRHAFHCLCLRCVEEAVVSANARAARIRVVAGIIVEGGRILLMQRSRSGNCPWAWECAGGKVEPGDVGDVHTLCHELVEEYGVHVAVMQDGPPPFRCSRSTTTRRTSTDPSAGRAFRRYCFVC